LRNFATKCEKKAPAQTGCSDARNLKLLHGGNNSRLNRLAEKLRLGRSLFIGDFGDGFLKPVPMVSETLAPKLGKWYPACKEFFPVGILKPTFPQVTAPQPHHEEELSVVVF